MGLTIYPVSQQWTVPLRSNIMMFAKLLRDKGANRDLVQLNMKHVGPKWKSLFRDTAYK